MAWAAVAGLGPAAAAGAVGGAADTCRYPLVRHLLLGRPAPARHDNEAWSDRAGWRRMEQPLLDLLQVALIFLLRSCKKAQMAVAAKPAYRELMQLQLQGTNGTTASLLLCAIQYEA